MQILDWTKGSEGIAYQTCPACKAVWYFRRTFCPQCGNAEPLERQASGQGVVHALTVVARAPSEALRAHAPYAIALIDTDEGFRMMAHAAADLAIGERVQCRFIRIAGCLLPSFEKIST